MTRMLSMLELVIWMKDLEPSTQLPGSIHISRQLGTHGLLFTTMVMLGHPLCAVLLKLFLSTVGTFLMSKEYFIFSFETNILFTGLLFMTIVVKKLTPGTNELLKGLQKDEAAVYVEYEQHCKGELQKTIDHYEKQIGNAEAIPMLYTAKRENLGLQLEAEYRERQQKVYSEVKRRLDYQVNTDNVKRRVEQQHMVNWIIDNVKKSITPETEKENLKACLTRLKGLSTA